MNNRHSRNRSAQSIIETVVGVMFLIPVVLFLFDVETLVMSNIAIDNLAKCSARAAASAADQSSNMGTAKSGYDAALAAAQSMAESGVVSKPQSCGSFVTGFCWNASGVPDYQGTSWPSDAAVPTSGDVGVVTSMTVKLPVPFPCIPAQMDMHALAIEPVVSMVGSNSGLEPGGGGGGPVGGGGGGGGGGNRPVPQ
jgi:hypothetical protein